MNKFKKPKDSHSLTKSDRKMIRRLSSKNKKTLKAAITQKTVPNLKKSLSLLKHFPHLLKDLKILIVKRMKVMTNRQYKSPRKKSNKPLQAFLAVYSQMTNA